MAGLGFQGAGGGRGRGGNHHMGIQFVKSGDGDKKPTAFQFGSPAKQFSVYSGNQSSTQGFVRSGEQDSKSFIVRRDTNSPLYGGKAKGPSLQQQTFKRAPSAQLVLTPEKYRKMWQEEKDPALVKIRKLAWEVANLKSHRPNAIDKLHSASNRVPTPIEFTTEPIIASRGSNSFLCHVFVQGVLVGSGEGQKIKDAKVNGYETALQKILMPELRINRIDFESRELEGSKVPFTWPPPEPSNTVLPKSCARLPPSYKGGGKPVPLHRESNLEAASVKRKIDEQRPLEDFVIVEPLVPIPDCTPAHTLRRSADFNHMLLEYEYTFCGENVRCVMKVEGQLLADVYAGSRLGAKNKAADQGLNKLRKICWIIKTKQAVDSDTKISKEEMLSELTDQSDALSDDNVGNKLLRKMGWSGGGVGKDGSGIAEPVALKSVINREGLGLGTEKGITDEYRRRVKEVIENYASSGNQEDLVFNCDFRLDERLIIHDICRKLNLRSKCKGKGTGRYLCVRRKRSANMLFDHIMSCGGETIRYKLVPPEEDTGESYLPSGSAHGTSPSSKASQSSNQRDMESKRTVGNGASSRNHSENTTLNGHVKRESHSIKQEVRCEIGPPPSLRDPPTENDSKREFYKSSGFSQSHQQNRFQFTNGSSKCHRGDERNPFDYSLLRKTIIKEEFVPGVHDIKTEVKQEIEPPPFVNGNYTQENSAATSYDGRFRNDFVKEEVDPDRPGGNNYYSGRGRYDYNHPNRFQNYHNRSGGPDLDTRNGTTFVYNSRSRPMEMQNSFMGQGNDGGGLYNQPSSSMPQNAEHGARQGGYSDSKAGVKMEQWPRGPQQNQQFLHNVAQQWGQMAGQWMAGQQGGIMGMQGGPRFNGNRGNWPGRGRMM